MSRPIAYNASGPLSGSIRGGNVNYTVDSGNRDYTTFASKKWVPSADGAAPIVFVTDTYTQGFELNPSLAVPLFYSCNGTGSAAIIYTANRIPGSPGNYSDANVALNDLITARGYFILESNDPYQGINADNLAFDVDASKMSSYPQTGTNWRDLSGKGTNGTLTNSPTWNSNGYFAFDGTDDYVNFPNDTALNSNSITVSSTFNPTSVGQNGFLFEKGYVNTQYALFFENPTFKLRFMFNGIGMQDFQVGASTYMTAGRWYNTIVTYDSSVAKMYINGTNVLSTTYNDTISVNNNGERIGAWYDGSGTGYHFNGSIANTQVYPRALTEAQVKQNYFGSPIVTDGLVFAVDANNIVSYPKSGTTLYNLTGSTGNSTLINGPTYNLSNGGSFFLDGTDDVIRVTGTQTALQTIGTGDFTMCLWVKIDTYQTGDAPKVLFNNKNAAAAAAGYGFDYFYGGGSDGKILWSTADGTSAVEIFSQNSFTSILGNWAYIVMVRQNGASNNGHFYVNGTYQPLASSATVLNVNTSTNMTLGNTADSYGAYFTKGNFANAKIYNKALTSDEVQQNYQAEQYRFETPAGPVTNGLLLYWDVGNLDSYPGTGTTIYDLSGNSNNGTLINGVGYNQTNGGVLVFDGVDDYVISYSPNLAATNNTVMGAARYSGGVRGRMIQAPSNNWLMGNWGNTTENYYAQGWVSTPGSGPSDTNWRIYSALGDVSGDSYSLYVNNSLSAGPNNGGSQGPNGILISDSSGGETSTGQFSFVLVYNRVLTTAEMTQNYNYFKGRFGL